ncbi:unnamed protein product [marine sediment metagenome]|uniref:Uncharacterized protein n=1 Tax=marine sediment metagenome TaxID=412755 RepID=X0W253_9ZZZZ
MSLWSESNTVVNAIIPVANAWDSAPVVSDIIHLENFNRCTFLIVTGATSAVEPVVTVFAGISNSSCDTAIAFKYRTQIAAVPGAAGSDVTSALIEATSVGFSMTAAKVGGIYIIEVDASDVAAAGVNFDHCAVNIAEDADTPQTGCVIAVLSEPRNPQAVLATAID